MTAATWTADELDRVGAAEELEIAPRRRDGARLRSVQIWVVRAGEGRYVRSWRGSQAAWFCATQRQRSGHVSADGLETDVAFADAGPEVCDAVDAAYREKHARYPSYVPPMLSDQARAATLKLVPADIEDGA